MEGVNSSSGLLRTEMRRAHAEHLEVQLEVAGAESSLLAEERASGGCGEEAAMLRSEISQLRWELSTTNSEQAALQRDGIAYQRQAAAEIAEMKRELRLLEKDTTNLGAEHDGLEHTLEAAVLEEGALSHHAACLLEEHEELALQMRSAYACVAGAARAALTEEAAEETAESRNAASAAAAAASAAARVAERASAEEADAASMAAVSETEEWQRDRKELDRRAREFECQATREARAERDAKVRSARWRKKTAEVLESLRDAERERDTLLARGKRQRRCAFAFLGGSALVLVPVLFANAWLFFTGLRVSDPSSSSMA